MNQLHYTPEDLNDSHAEFRKMVIDLFNQKIKFCRDADYSLSYSLQELKSFTGYLSGIVQEISQRACQVLEKK